MRNLIIIVLVLVGLGYIVSDVSRAFQKRNDFQARVDQWCGAVTASSFDSIKQTLVQDAQKLGLKLRPVDIRISYTDAPEQRTLAQNIVGDRLGTQFVNKRATIECRVIVPVLGLGIGQEIASSRLIQVKAVESRGKSELETQVDAAPPF